MRKLTLLVLAFVALALPAAAYADNTYFSGLMGPGGAAASGLYTTHTYSQIQGTYVAGRTYRVGYAVACCGGGSFYSGSTFQASSNMTWWDTVASSKGYCERSTAGSGSSTITCTTNV